MSSHATIQVGVDRFRVGTWHADDQIAYIAPMTPTTGPSPAGVMACVERLRSQGYRGAVTSALRDDEAQSFIKAGFDHQEALDVLRRSLVPRSGVPRPAMRTRRARAADHSAVLAVDHAAFTPFWQLDVAGLIEAVAATPSSRFRVVGRPIVAYAICGRADRIGYLQRLAVHPDHSRQGVGTALVADALTWLARHGAREVLVNTQQDNVTAVALYRQLAFHPDDERLVVLRSRW